LDGQVAASVRFTADIYADLRRMMSVADSAALTEMFKGGDGPYLVTFNGRHIASFVKVPRGKRAEELAQAEEGVDEIESVEVVPFPLSDVVGKRGKVRR
jgi:hypothetical protein